MYARGGECVLYILILYLDNNFLVSKYFRRIVEKVLVAHVEASETLESEHLTLWVPAL